MGYKFTLKRSNKNFKKMSDVPFYSNHLSVLESDTRIQINFGTMEKNE